jgi:hypothetical protein
MTRSLVALLTLAALLAIAAPAGADPLTVKSSSPADGAEVPLTPTGGIPWEIAVSGVPDDAGVSVTISSSPATAPDGTLTTDNRADFFFLTTTTPGSWSGRSDPGPDAWSATAGRYYWQVIATWTDASGTFHKDVTGIARLFLGVKPPAASGGGGGAGGAAPTRRPLRMSGVDAPFYVRTMIRLRTHRAPARLRYGCARRSTTGYRCRPTWRDGRNTYRATASFTHVRSGRGVVARATVTGRRASLQCVRQRSFASCARTFRWRATLPARPAGTR